MAAIRALLNDDPSPISEEGSLAGRTRSLLKTFDAESGDVNRARYADWMADMLDQWLLRYADFEEARTWR